jgi:hypothetical protein
MSFAMARKSPESKPMTRLWDLMVLSQSLVMALLSSLRDHLDPLAFYL